MFSFARVLSLSLVALPFVSAAVHDVQVGPNGQLAYSPEAISAQVGDQVVFHFNPKNHTVTQSSFANPCAEKAGGFDSGFEPVMANSTYAQPTFTITVNDTQPIWVYCRQTGHCEKGMVFAVNCGGDGSANSFTNFQNAALAQGANESSSSYGSAPTYTSTPVAAPSSTGTAAGAASTGGQVHTVIVGGAAGLVYTPSNISAQPGDIVTFEFHQENHTVTQSSFASPCSPLNANGNTGFDSGFNPVASNATTFPTFNYTVTDTSPVWAYCRQGNGAHCHAGMVFAINANESSPNTFEAFLNKAESSGNTTSSSASSSPTGTSSGSGSSGSSSSGSSSSGSSSSDTNGNGAISFHLGGTSVTLAAVALLALVL